MAIIDYSSLQSAVAAYLHRDDLTTNIPDFISLAEARLNRRLRIRAMENRATGTSSAGLIALPTGYREGRSLHISQGGTYRRIDYVTPERAGLYNDSGYTSAFTVVGSNIELLPMPTQDVDYRLVYYKALDALSGTQNWLILNAPDIYLYATLLESAPFIKGDTRIPVWQGMLEQAISDLEAEDRMGAMGGNTVGMVTDNSVRLG
ncbi:MAG TPA: hypothetical protein VFM34_05170 [Moraxellaceae bacterium]|nr:hypothetical protein [Moraxellaceae bacterium]